jgi:2Fe-2S ferredoxin
MECGSTKPSELAAAGVEHVRVRAADTRDERRNAMPKITFIERDGNRREVEAPVGLSILEIAHRNSIDIEGACEGSLACSTCHVIVAPEDFERLPDAAEEEEDMLDLAWGLTKTSRLGCQIIITEELDGLTVSLPTEVHNALID